MENTVTWPAGLELQIVQLVPVGILVALASLWGAEHVILQCVRLLRAVERLLDAARSLMKRLDDL